MSYADWAVLGLTLAVIILYGVWKSRGQQNLDSYFLGNRSVPWYIVLLSIMGTQASAITFLSAPGQAYADGMRFVQYYFGLPLAMIVICVAFVPIYHKLKVYTAYEYLENRFDLKTRTLTSFLFLLQRALSTGISIYAPASSCLPCWVGISITPISSWAACSSFIPCTAAPRPYRIRNRSSWGDLRRDVPGGVYGGEALAGGYRVL